LDWRTALGFAGAILLIIAVILILAGLGIISHSWIKPGRRTTCFGMALAMAGAVFLFLDATSILSRVIPPVADAPAERGDQAPQSPTPTDQTTQTLKPGESLLLTFTSGVSSETGRQRVGIETGGPGNYIVELENANPTYSGYWIVWDYIALMDVQTPVWKIGEDEAPTDYSKKAFSEFCDPELRQDCVTDYTVGSTRDSDFCKDLNDGLFPLAKIKFNLSQDQASRSLTLVLSTLYSTHDGAEHFRMKVSLRKK
jgi:hypothetical protein